jgi:hypothetical protein
MPCRSFSSMKSTGEHLDALVVGIAVPVTLALTLFIYFTVKVARIVGLPTSSTASTAIRAKD